MVEYEWGREAITRFPELIENFDRVDSPYSLWYELTRAFSRAYIAPRNEDLISRIYAFSDWCLNQPEGKTAADDLATVVCSCFYEHIPESPEALEDMPNWFPRSDVLSMKPIFSYMVGEEGFKRILKAYEKKPKARSRRT